jgi:hypothetical protein
MMAENPFKIVRCADTLNGCPMAHNYFALSETATKENITSTIKEDSLTNRKESFLIYRKPGDEVTSSNNYNIIVMHRAAFPVGLEMRTRAGVKTFRFRPGFE